MQRVLSPEFIIINIILIVSTTAYPSQNDQTYNPSYAENIYFQVGSPCDTTNDCQVMGGSSICDNGICICPPDPTNNDYFWCVPTTASATPPSTTSMVNYDSVLGYYCETNDNCGGLVAFAVCVNKICVCQEGYTADGIYNCVPGEGPPTTTPTTTVMSTTTFTLWQDSVIGGSCSTNVDCTVIGGNSTCINGICDCEAGYVPLDELSCVPITRPSTPPPTPPSAISMVNYDNVLGYHCETNDNCGFVAFAVCVNKICGCQEGYTADGIYNCVPGEGPPTTTPTTILMLTTGVTLWQDSVIGGSCSTNVDCTAIGGNSTCINGICACEPGYVPLDELSCVPIKGETSSVSTTLKTTDSIQISTTLTTRFCPNGRRCCRKKYR